MKKYTFETCAFNVMKKFIKLLSISLLLIAPIHYSQAAMITVNGANVSFTYDNATLFGSANIVGNSIFFLPTNFSAESLNGAGVVSANATLNITVEAITSGYAIENFLLQESGDYKLSGTGASANVDGMLAVTSLTKTGGFFPMPYRQEQLFSAGSLNNTGGALAQWSASSGIDLAATAGWGFDTKVKVTLENLLDATTLNSGEQAFVEKKFGAIGLVVNPVPVPAALVLFGSGLLGLIGIARRRVRA